MNKRNLKKKKRGLPGAHLPCQGQCYSDSPMELLKDKYKYPIKSKSGFGYLLYSSNETQRKTIRLEFK
jgi:hypothetical protein